MFKKIKNKKVFIHVIVHDILYSSGGLKISLAGANNSVPRTGLTPYNNSTCIIVAPKKTSTPAGIPYVLHP